MQEAKMQRPRGRDTALSTASQYCDRITAVTTDTHQDVLIIPGVINITTRLHTFSALLPGSSTQHHDASVTIIPFFIDKETGREY